MNADFTSTDLMSTESMGADPMGADPMNADTAALPPPRPKWLPEPGSYRAEAGRCFLEISASVGPLTTLRGRLAVLDNQLTVDGGDHLSSLCVEASTGSLRTTRPLVTRKLRGGRGLDSRAHRVVRFEPAAIDEVDRKLLSIPGDLYLRGEPVRIRLKTRVIGRDDDRLLILGTARVSYRAVREACSFWLPWSVPADHVRILLAADFR
jgi:polyisoprenoid-binding protein YceI